MALETHQNLQELEQYDGKVVDFKKPISFSI
jgi:hypothetical protein